MQAFRRRIVFCTGAFILCASLAVGHELRFFMLTASPDYENVLARQPDGLKLTLTLPKNHFYQGEIMEATLTYSNFGKDSYAIWLAKGDRSGRIQDIRFFGYDERGAAVDDPIGWIYSEGFAGGGPGQHKDLGIASMTLAVNQWLRFDHPGTYTISAITTNVRQSNPAMKLIGPIVSNKITVTITPLPPDEEKRIIADSMQKIEAGYDREDSPMSSAERNEDNAHEKAYAAEPAIATWRYLQTPAARAALRSRLDKTPEYMLADRLGMRTVFLSAARFCQIPGV